MNEQVRNLADATSHAQLLDRMAEVAVRVGLGLKPGQEVVVTAPLDAVALVRRITEHAYKAGAVSKPSSRPWRKRMSVLSSSEKIVVTRDAPAL